MFKQKDTIELYHFLQCVSGNWRNALYIECNICPYSSLMCSGYLITADVNLKPVLYPIRKLYEMTGETAVKDECVGSISIEAFNSIYSCWVLWNTQPEKKCNIQKIYSEANRTTGGV